MRRWVKVQLVWLAIVVPAFLVVVLVYGDRPPGTAVQIGIGLTVGIVAGVVAELLVDWQQTRRFRAAWRKAMAEGKPPRVIE